MTDKVQEVKINNSKINIIDIVETDEKKIDKEPEIENEAANEPHINIEAPELDYEVKEDVEEIRKRITLILRYKNSKRFGSWLKSQGFNFNTKNLEGKTVAELETMINDLRFCISTKNTNSLYETGATKGILILENLLRPVYKIDGLSQALTNDPAYLDLIEELLLERANFIYIKPEYRLLYCVVSSAYIVHSQHVMLEKLSQTSEGKEMIKQMATQLKERETQVVLPVLSGVAVEEKNLENNYIDKYSDLLGP